MWFVFIGKKQPIKHTIHRFIHTSIKILNFQPVHITNRPQRGQTISLIISSNSEQWSMIYL